MIVRKYGYSQRLICVFLAALLLSLAGQAFASTLQSGDAIHVSNLHEIDDDLYVFCEKLNVDGSISGDLLAFVYRCEINGELGQSASIVSRTAINGGRIGGSLRAFSERLTQNGHIRGSLMAFAGVAELSRSSVIERDVHAFGGEINIDGVIKGNLTVKAKDVVLSGLIEGDVDVECAKIVITPPLVVRGNMAYRAEEELNLEDMAGVNIIGEVTYSEPEEREEEGNLGASIVYKTADVLGTFLLGLLAVAFFRPFTTRSVHQLRSRPTVSLAVGLLALVAFLFFATILLISAVFAGLGGLILADTPNFGGLVMIGVSLVVLPVSTLVSMASVILLYAGKIVFAIWLGTFVVKLRGNVSSQLMALFLGLVALTILYLIPFLGTLVLLIVTILGAGAAVLGAGNCNQGMPNQG